jgi:hypothetical protein
MTRILLKSIVKFVAPYLERLLGKQPAIKVKRKRPRVTSSTNPTPMPFRRNYMNCMWWEQYLNNDSVKDPSTQAAKNFRKRFRVPFEVYEQILNLSTAMAPAGLGYDLHPVSAAGIYGIPLQLQILAVLRVLGRSTC